MWSNGRGRKATNLEIGVQLSASLPFIRGLRNASLLHPRQLLALSRRSHWLTGFCSRGLTHDDASVLTKRSGLDSGASSNLSEGPQRFAAVASSITNWSDTQIVATVPAGATTGMVKVVSGGINSNTSVSFTVGAVVVNSIAPTSGPGGTQIQINGSGFGATQGSSWVGIGPYSAAVVSWSNTQIVAKAPPVALIGAVKVTAGGVASNADQNFTVLAPTVASISPTNGPVGTQVTINGSGFGATQGSITAAINSVNLAIISWSGTQIVATVPTTAVTGSVKVTNGGVPSNTNLYFTVPARQVTGVSPASAAVGSQITITGTGFHSAQGSGFVYLYPNRQASVVSWSDTQIVATVPSGVTTGPVEVWVNGQSSNSDVVLNMPSPVVSSLSPTMGSAGTQVTITGHDFGSTQGSSTLKFNTASGTIVNWSDTQIVAAVPNAATSGPVLVSEGGVTSNQNINFTVPAPQITSISPSSGPIGTQVTINGSGFQVAQGSNSIHFYGGSAPTINSWSDTQIIATVSNSTTTGPVNVSVNGVSSNQNIVFEVPAPVVTGIVPSRGPIGTQVQINGSGFGATQSDSTIVFANTAATVVSWSDTQIIATVPPVFTSAAKVTVGAVASNSNIYFTIPPPQITSISPASGVVSTQVTINGSGFLPTQGNSSVAFSSEATSPTVITWSDTQIVATVPGGSGSGPVTVTAHGSTSSQDVILTMPNPYVASLSPTSGPVSTQVTISGTGFGATQGSSTITFNGQTPSLIASWSDAQIVAIVPNLARSGPVIAQVGGVTGNLNVYFTVPAPEVTSITPNIGGEGNTVTITGTGFQTVKNELSNVAFYRGGTAAIANWSDTQIVATVPPGARTGPAYVNVSAVSSNPANYSIPNNFVASLSPAIGPVGTQVTITGTGFGATQGTSALTFNGQLPTSIASWSDTQIVATVPVTAAAGPVSVSVNNIPGNLTTIFTVPAPKITAMSPVGGVAGTQVTITGSGFQTNQRDSTVTFNGVPATVTSWSDTQIATTVPGTAGSGPLLVTVNLVNNGNGNFFEVPHPVITSVDPPCGPAYGLYTIHGSGFTENQGPGQVYINGLQEGVAYLPPGNNVPDWHDTSIVIQLHPSTTSGPLTVTRYDATSNSLPFAVSANPVITSVSPAVAPVGGSVTISGSGFCATQSSNTIQFGGVAANVTSWSDSQIVATVPPGASSGPLVVSVAGIEGSGASFNVSTDVQVT